MVLTLMSVAREEQHLIVSVIQNILAGMER